MSMYWSPVIVCHNPDCKGPIRLPYSNLLKIEDDRPMWPTGTFRVTFVCHWCGRGFEYSAQDVHWATFETPGPSQDHSELDAFYCEFECDHEDCKKKARHYMLGKKGTDPAVLLNKALNSRCNPRCGKGDLINTQC